MLKMFELCVTIFCDELCTVTSWLQQHPMAPSSTSSLVQIEKRKSYLFSFILVLLTSQSVTYPSSYIAEQGKMRK